MHHLDWLQESLWLSALYMDPGMSTAIEGQRDSFIKNSLGIWRTTLEDNSTGPHQEQICQGHALVPLLFCIDLLSKIIDKIGYGYQLNSNGVAQSLATLLYSCSQWETNSLIHTTRIYRNDNGMSSGLEKCIQVDTKRGMVVGTQGTALPESNIADIEDSYK